MSTKTTNLDLTLMSGQDNFDTDTVMDNFTKIDTAIGSLNDNISTLNSNSIKSFPQINLSVSSSDISAVAKAINAESSIGRSKSFMVVVKTSDNHYYLCSGYKGTTNITMTMTEISWKNNTYSAYGENTTSQHYVTKLNDFYYQPGDVIDFTTKVAVGGYLTGTAKSLQFSFPVKKRLDNISSVTINRLTGGVRLINGTYLNNSSTSYEWIGAKDSGNTALTFQAAIEPNTQTIKIIITATNNFSGTAPTNNTPVGVEFSCKLTLS